MYVKTCSCSIVRIKMNDLTHHLLSQIPGYATAKRSSEGKGKQVVQFWKKIFLNITCWIRPLICQIFRAAPNLLSGQGHNENLEANGAAAIFVSFCYSWVLSIYDFVAREQNAARKRSNTTTKDDFNFNTNSRKMETKWDGDRLHHETAWYCSWSAPSQRVPRWHSGNYASDLRFEIAGTFPDSSATQGKPFTHTCLCHQAG